VRDDSSNDDTRAIIRKFAARDARITFVEEEPVERLGVVRAFGRLLEAVGDAHYVMFADQDDVWLETKVSSTLAAMRGAESTARNPVLVHTDLVVVDANLRVIADSFWRYSRVSPEPVSLRRLVVQNVATGAATMINRPLIDLACPMGEGVMFHDWWFACVAAAFGSIVAVHEASVLYRQHGGNAVGARSRSVRSLRDALTAGMRYLRGVHAFRNELTATCQQAGELLARFDRQLNVDDRRFLAAFATIPQRAFLRRKFDVARLRLRREYGFWRNLGVLLRA
jgi:Glycosyl transferase family 2.